MDRRYHSKSRTISRDDAIIACNSETSRRCQNLGERRSLIGTNVKRSQRWKTSTDELIDTSFETIIFNKNHSCDKKLRSRDQHLSDQSERFHPPRRHVHQSYQRNLIDEEYDDVDQRDFLGLFGRNDLSAGSRREKMNEISNRLLSRPRTILNKMSSKVLECINPSQYQQRSPPEAMMPPTFFLYDHDLTYSFPRSKTNESYTEGGAAIGPPTKKREQEQMEILSDVTYPSTTDVGSV